MLFRSFLPLPFAATERNGEILRDTSSPLHQAASSKFKADNEKKVNYGSGEIFALGRSIDSLLKDFKRSPRVIKVDVEGAELLVLRGAVQTLREVEAVVVEVNLDAHCQQFGYRFAEIFEFLDLHGFENRYEVKNVDNSVRQLGAREYIPGDILFARRKLTL